MRMISASSNIQPRFGGVYFEHLGQITRMNSVAKALAKGWDKFTPEELTADIEDREGILIQGLQELGERVAPREHVISQIYVIVDNLQKCDYYKASVKVWKTILEILTRLNGADLVHNAGGGS